MAESSMFWGGVSEGDCGPYDQEQFSEFMMALFCTDPTTQGVIRGMDLDNQNLGVGYAGGGILRVDSGNALVYGTLLHLPGFVDFTVEFNAGHDNYYRVVLRKDWAAKTVRAVLLGPKIGSFPVLTQVAGTIWEISLTRLICNTVADSISGYIDDSTYCVFPSND